MSTHKTLLNAVFFSFKAKVVCRMFEVNVKAVINVSQVVAKGMIKQGRGGSIVNISSQASKVNCLLYNETWVMGS